MKYLSSRLLLCLFSCLFGGVVLIAQRPEAPSTMKGADAAATKEDPFGPWEEWDNHDFVRFEARAIPRPTAPRFSPSYAPFSVPLSFRLVIHFRKDGGAEGEMDYRSASNLRRSGPDGQLEPVGGEIQRFPFTWSSAQASERLEELWDVAAASEQTIASRIGEIQIEGSDYEIRIETPLAKQVWELFDEDVTSGVTGRMPIVRWMHQIRFGLAPSRSVPQPSNR